MTDVRSFVAVPLSVAVQQAVFALADELAPALPGVRWSRKVENMHVTVKFLGNVGQDRLAAFGAELQAALADVPVFPIEVRGMGAFPSARRASVIWAGIDDPSGGLQRTAALVEDVAAKGGVGEREARPFRAHVTVGRAKVPLPPGAFLQATAKGEGALARLVLAHAGNAKRVADLFCGIGTFALRVAESARVTAVDSDASAVKALQQAAAKTSGLKPIDAQARDLLRRPLMASELKGFDAVVFDPPRQGAERQALELAKSAVPCVIAVSCDAPTFARDAGILVRGGYKPATITPVDQFRYSFHVEIVAKFER